jgi:hypothetical protein
MEQHPKLLVVAGMVVVINPSTRGFAMSWDILRHRDHAVTVPTAPRTKHSVKGRTEDWQNIRAYLSARLLVIVPVRGMMVARHMTVFTNGDA